MGARKQRGEGETIGKVKNGTPPYKIQVNTLTVLYASVIDSLGVSPFLASSNASASGNLPARPKSWTVEASCGNSASTAENKTNKKRRKKKLRVKCYTSESKNKENTHACRARA